LCLGEEVRRKPNKKKEEIISVIGTTCVIAGPGRRWITVQGKQTTAKGFKELHVHRTKKRGGQEQRVDGGNITGSTH